IALAQDPSTENSHSLRRQAKYLWYQLSLLRKQLPASAQPLIADLGELGELLGDDNDLAVLVDTLGRNPQICSNRVRAELIASLAETRRVVLLSAALRLSQRIYRHKPGRFIRDLESGN
ncbi:MAG: CHAD domain-containing protein, partial [Thiohalobacterales bacterium]|nr:CHAD domain-containing protein [Thiohalobacterales bacterium]